MNIIVVGYGRFGQTLVENLRQEDNYITVLDINPQVLEDKPVYRNVTYKTGVGFDKDVLESAGIAHTDAVITCTSDDEVNALIARIAKNIYLVPKVVACQYNSKNYSIYQMLGIETFSTTDWGAKRVINLLNKTDLDSIASIGNSDVEIVRIIASPILISKNVMTINSIGVQVISILRDSKGFIPEAGTVIEKNDTLFIAVEHSNLIKLKNVLGI